MMPQVIAATKFTFAIKRSYAGSCAGDPSKLKEGSENELFTKRAGCIVDL